MTSQRGGAAWRVPEPQSADVDNVQVRMVVFFTVVNALWALFHAYLGWRVISPLRLTGPPFWYAVGLCVLLALIVPVGLFGARFVGQTTTLGHGLNIAGYTYMGLFMMAFPVFVARDLLYGIGVVGASGLAMVTSRAAEDLLPSPERRAFADSMFAAAVGLMTLGAGAYGYRSAMSLPPYKRVTVSYPNLPPGLDGYRIAQISDIHIGAPLTRDQLAAIVQKTNALGADLIAVTGDLVDGQIKALKEEVSPIAELKAEHGVYFVTGNHEYYSGHRAWCDEVSRLGLTVLNNAHRIVERQGARLLVAGVTDYTAGQFDPEHASDPRKALEGAPEHDFRLLLAHQPKTVPAAVEAGYDLQLSGHTHGGQFFPGPLFIDRFHPIAAGLGTFGRLQVYVSRGTGCWGPPLRTGAPPEITEITLRRA